MASATERGKWAAENVIAPRDLPAHNLDGVPPGTDRRVLFFERARLLWVDIEDGTARGTPRRTVGRPQGGDQLCGDQRHAPRVRPAGLHSLPRQAVEHQGAEAAMRW